MKELLLKFIRIQPIRKFNVRLAKAAQAGTKKFTMEFSANAVPWTRS